MDRQGHTLAGRYYISVDGANQYLSRFQIEPGGKTARLQMQINMPVTVDVRQRHSGRVRAGFGRHA